MTSEGRGISWRVSRWARTAGIVPGRRKRDLVGGILCAEGDRGKLEAANVVDVVEISIPG